MVEQWPFKPKVVGSIPTAPTKTAMFLRVPASQVQKARIAPAWLKMGLINCGHWDSSLLSVSRGKIAERPGCPHVSQFPEKNGRRHLPTAPLTVRNFQPESCSTIPQQKECSHAVAPRPQAMMSSNFHISTGIRATGGALRAARTAT